MLLVCEHAQAAVFYHCLMRSESSLVDINPRGHKGAHNSDYYYLPTQYPKFINSAQPVLPVFNSSASTFKLHFLRYQSGLCWCHGALVWLLSRLCPLMSVEQHFKTLWQVPVRMPWTRNSNSLTCRFCQLLFLHVKGDRNSSP